MTSNNFNERAYAEFIVKAGCVNVGQDFILSRGQRSPYHIKFDNLLASGPAEKLVGYVRDFLSDREIDVSKMAFLGVPLGGTSPALDFSRELGNGSRILVRPTEKERANFVPERYFYGKFSPGDEAILVEDTLTTGNALGKTWKWTQEVGLNVTKAIIFCNRDEYSHHEEPTAEYIAECDKDAKPVQNGRRISAVDFLESKGLEILSLTDIHTLLPLATHLTNPSDEIILAKSHVEYYGSRGAKLETFAKEVYVSNMGLMGNGIKILPHQNENNELLAAYVDAGVFSLREDPRKTL